MRKSSLFLLPGLVWIAVSLSGCDDTPGVSDISEQVSEIVSVQLTPAEIAFGSGQAVGDTTVVITFSAGVLNPDPQKPPSFAVFDTDNDDIPIAEGVFSPASNPALFTAEIPILLNTADFKTFNFFAFTLQDNGRGNSAIAVLKSTGVTGNPPVLLAVNNPEEVQIPSSSTPVGVRFTAKVADPDGQSNIDRVLLNFRNADGSLLLASPAQLFDDGRNSSPDDSGDLVAGDSTFTVRFFVDSTNTPSNRTVLYWAIDKSGLSSDTLQRPFNIVQ